MDRDLRGQYAGVGQDALGDPVGQGLQEVDRLPLDHRDHGGGHGGVVDGVVEAVRDRRHRGAARPQVEGDVHGEELSLLAFEGQDAVMATG